MFIKNIKIKNFKAFNEEIVIDLNPNSNGIESDLENDLFIKMKDNKTYFCPIVSISGANASGKTSILDSLNIIKNIIGRFEITDKDLNSFIMMSNPNNINNNLFNNRQEANAIAFEINSIIKKMFGIININNFIYLNKEKFCETLKEQEITVKKYPIWKFLSWEIIFTILSSKYINVVNYWKDNKHFKNIVSYIQITLFDYESNKEFVFRISDELEKENKLIFEIETNEDVKLFNTNELNLYSDKILDFLTKIFLFEDKEKFLKFDPSFVDENYSKLFIANHRNAFLYGLILEIKDYMKIDDEEAISFVENILSVVDKSIIGIEFINNKNKLKSGIKQINLIDGSSVILDKLSDGTAKFIELFFIVILFLKNNYYCTLLIDEFDSLMHIELVNFFKRLIIKVNKMKKNKIQLIFTSHNYDCLTDNLSTKQMFFIDEIDGIKAIKKVSSIISPNNSPKNMYKKQIIGSHPFSSDVDDLLFEVLKGGKNE